MRIAVLVLAHKNPGQLQHLVSRLTEDFDVFLHLDRASLLDGRDLASLTRVTVIRDYRVIWGGPTLVDATVALLRAAAPSHYDRYVVISGQDLPVRSNADIAEFYAAHASIDFMELDQLTHWNRGIERVTRFHLFSPSRRSGWRSRAARMIGRTADRLAELVHLTPRPWDWEFRGGSNWFDLTGSTVDRILAFLQDNPGFRRRFRWTWNSDEVFFQTALMAVGLGSPAPAPIPRYIDWSAGGSHPRTLGVADLPAMLHSGATFARKFDESVDSTVIDQLLAQTRGSAAHQPSDLPQPPPDLR